MQDINQIKKEEKKFIDLAVVQQLKYAKVEEEMHVSRAQLTKWWGELKDLREYVSNIRKIWIKKCTEIPFWDFYHWYNNTPRKCCYCNIMEDEIKILIDRSKIRTKRLITRGRKLEIERMQPNESYDNIDNLVYACYWCNNAKTDEFTKEEFIPVGKAIQKIWRERLK